MQFENILALLTFVAIIQAADPPRSISQIMAARRISSHSPLPTLGADGSPPMEIAIIPTNPPNISSLTAIPITTESHRLTVVQTLTWYEMVNASNNASISSVLSRHSKVSTGGSNPNTLNVGVFGAAIAAGAAFLL